MNMKRMRGRNHRGGGAPQGGGGGGGGSVRQGGGIPMNRNHVFDSSGPDLRIRGTAQQLFEKYLQLGRDATGVGDRVMAESYFQHAEHYFRIINAMTQAQAQQGQNQNGGQNPQQGNGNYNAGQNGNGAAPQANYQGRGGRNDTGYTDMVDDQDTEGEPAGYGDQPDLSVAEPENGAVVERHIPINGVPPDA